MLDPRIRDIVYWISQRSASNHIAAMELIEKEKDEVVTNEEILHLYGEQRLMVELMQLIEEKFGKEAQEIDEKIRKN